MRRWPSVNRVDAIPAAPPVPGGVIPPNWQGDTPEPFLVSGGATFFIETDAPPTPFQPAAAGVQLVCSVYVPYGRIGFLKQLRVAPFMPTELTDPWETRGIILDDVFSWREFDSTTPAPVRPGGTHGVWASPFGWESYFDAISCGEQPPQWTWQLRLVRGDVSKDRKPFSLLDPSSWYLVPNLAVPALAYAGGIPGAAPSGYWGSQRMQVIQGDELDTHVIVPQDTSLCLFTQWTQNPFQPRANVDGTPRVPYGPEVYPLLPSFGQLHGYVQATDRLAAYENALFGWGG
jgi:hypothetical protein